MPDKINARPAWNAGRVTISFDVRDGSLSVKGSINLATIDARLTAAAIIAAADKADEKVAKKQASELRRKKWRDREIAAGRMRAMSASEFFGR